MSADLANCPSPPGESTPATHLAYGVAEDPDLEMHRDHQENESHHEHEISEGQIEDENVGHSSKTSELEDNQDDD